MSKAQGKQADDEDLYSGYHDLNANTEVIMKTVAATSKAAESDPLAALRPPTGSQAGAGAVPAAGADGPRPMTSVRAAGYSSAGKRPGDAKVFDPLKQQSGPAPPLQQRSADSPEYQARDMEKAVNRLIEESAAANVAEQYGAALEKAKEAGKRERALCKHREKNGLADQINVELTYAVCFNLANQYHANGMLTEALNTYSVVVKNKQYPQAARLRVNMGNIYYQQKKYPMAIKMYRMAMDQMAGNSNASSRDMRFKIMRNIGDSFVRLGQFQDAIHHFEAIMDGTGVTAQNAQAHAAAQAALGGNAGPGLAADAQTGFNLIVCYYAIGDKEKMKRSFELLLSVPEFHDDDEDDDDDDHRPDRKKPKASDDIHIPAPPAGPVSTNPNAPTNAAAARTAAAIAAAAETVDELRAERTARKKRLHRYVLMAAKLVAPVIEKDGPAGFDWVIDALKSPPKPGGRAGAPKPVSAAAAAGAKSTFASIAMELEIAKGIAFLKRKEISAAIDVFKGFERKDNSAQLIDQAATNLSFLYFLEGDHKNAEKYAEMAVKADRYNAKALVNKANYIFARSDQHSLEAAKELYLEAIGVEADCVEAIYNLGLTNKRLGHLEDALQAFKKLHRIIPKDPQVVYQIANLLELMDDTQQAAEWFKVLHGAVPTDPKVLYRLGMLYNKEDDETQASHNFIESYQHYPVNMEVISWLGIWYVKSGNYEQAIQFFERAAEISPEDVKWKLMVASCYRRNDDIHKALHLYKQIHKQEPENIECLRYLCIICKDLNDPAWEDYNRALKKAEREQQKSNEKSGFMAGEVNPNGGGGEPPAGDLKMAPQLAGAGGKLETPSTSPTGSRDGPRPSVGHGQLPSGEDRNEQAGGGAAAGRGAGQQQVDANSDFKTHLSPRSQGRTLQAKEKGDEEDPFDDGDLLP